MNRGSCAPVISADGASNRFNEAPIHESGKLAELQGKRLHRRRFNEAPIHESGKCP